MTVPDFSPTLRELQKAVGRPAFGRGRGYAHGGRVLSLVWEPEEEALRASVVGSGRTYRTTAYFYADPDGALRYAHGSCTCPVGRDCKHAAAITIAASQGRVQRTAEPAPTGPDPSDWERPLRELLATGVARSAGAPLAIALEPRQGHGGDLQLHARLKRPGAKGNWINGSLNWHGLARWNFGEDEYRADHLALASELHGMFEASRTGRTYYAADYGPGQGKTIDLAAFNSPQLWPLLDRARRDGVALLHGRAELGEVGIVSGELCLDVRDGSGARSGGDEDEGPGNGRTGARAEDDAGGGTGGSDGFDVRVALRVDDEAASLVPLAFLGESGHGLVCTTAHAAAAGLDPSRWPLRLVRLERPAPEPLRAMVLAGTRLRIPPQDAERFAHEISPGLRRHAPVVSTDGSFAVPEVAAPRLTLRAEHRGDHELELAWGWRYEVDGRTRDVPFAPDGTGFRDPVAEQETLDATALPDDDLRRLGLVDGAGRPRGGGPVALTGLDTATVTETMLPRLAADGVEVEQHGTPADYRDVGDALEIGLSTRANDDDLDWFDLGVTISADGQDVPFADVFAALARGASHVLLADGAHFSLQIPKLQALRALIDEARDLADAPPGTPLRISRYQTGLWEDLVALGVVTEQAAAWQRQVDGLARLDRLPEHGLPRGLDADLRAYQHEGFRWLAQLWDLQLGGILADDMGLGKTLQALALIAHAKERDPATGPFLVVAPTSVVPGWVTEAARFTPGLAVRAVTDTLAKARLTLDEALDGIDVLVTTYTLLRLDDDHYGRVPWAGVILDEAQQVKNRQAKTHGCVRRLDAPFKLAITGTPMENDLMELWSLLSITAPGLFPSPKRFTDEYARPIERTGDADRLDRLRRRVRPLMLRRTKELVAADLPQKQLQTLAVPLHPRHRTLYDKHLQRERRRILGLLEDFDKNRFTILRAITLLRQMSLHAALVDDDHATVPCAKLGALVEQLEDVVGGGHRALVFSQFTGFLSLVRERLTAEGIGTSYLDGKTRKRAAVVEGFKSGDDPVFLISLKAGGFGLNLTEADYCFLLDPWWNPATEAQAIDRTHRIGQTRPVMVYRMLSADTIEEKVAELAQRKAALFTGVMDDGDLFSGSVTADDIRALLG